MEWINLTTWEEVTADEQPEGFVALDDATQAMLDEHNRLEAEAQAERERLAAEEAARLEAERLQREADAKAERERIAAREQAATEWLDHPKFFNERTLALGSLPAVPSPLPTSVGPTFGTPTNAQKVEWYQAQGWRIATAQDDIDAQTRAEAAAAAAQAASEAAYIADLQANAKFYTLQNAYLLLCESIVGTKTKLTGEAMAVAVAQLKSQDQAQGEKLESAFVFLSGAMVYYNPKWWDEVQYRDVPELVNGAQQLLALKG